MLACVSSFLMRAKDAEKCCKALRKPYLKNCVSVSLKRVFIYILFSAFKEVRMRRILLTLVCVFNTVIIFAGVSNETKVETPEGLKEVGELKKGDFIATLSKSGLKKMKKIESIEDVETDECVKTTLSDGTQLFSSKNQLIYIPTRKVWLPVVALLKGDKVMKHDNSEIEIVNNEIVNEKLKLRFMVIDKNQNFFATENGIVMHNGAVGAAVGVVAGASAVQASYGVATYAVGAVATTLVGPAAAAGVVAVWGFWTFYPVLYATKVAGLAGGIALGVATGPV